MLPNIFQRNFIFPKAFLLTKLLQQLASLAAPAGRLCSAGTPSSFHDHIFIQTNREDVDLLIKIFTFHLFSIGSLFKLSLFSFFLL